MTYHQVMPEYLDFMSVFGDRVQSPDPIFCSFREQTFLGRSVQDLSNPELGRMGQFFQLCYNFKTVARITPPTTNLKHEGWSVRQAAFHHQFDVVEGTTLWIVTKGHLEIYERIKLLTDNRGRPQDRDFSSPASSFRCSLTVHLLHAHWSLENWLTYVQWLDVTFKEKASELISVSSFRNSAYMYVD